MDNRFCEETGKTIYSKAGAKTAIRKIKKKNRGRGMELFTHPCSWCNELHLTKVKPKDFGKGRK